MSFWTRFPIHACASSCVRFCVCVCVCVFMRTHPQKECRVQSVFVPCKLFVIIYIYCVHNRDISMAHLSVVYWDLLTSLLTRILSISFFLPVAGCMVRMRPRRQMCTTAPWMGRATLTTAPSSTSQQSKSSPLPSPYQDRETSPLSRLTLQVWENIPD